MGPVTFKVSLPNRSFISSANMAPHKSSSAKSGKTQTKGPLTTTRSGRVSKAPERYAPPATAVAVKDPSTKKTNTKKSSVKKTNTKKSSVKKTVTNKPAAKKPVTGQAATENPAPARRLLRRQILSSVRRMQGRS